MPEWFTWSAPASQSTVTVAPPTPEQQFEVVMAQFTQSLRKLLFPGG